MGENDSDDSAVASKDTQSTRSTRGKICLNGLAKRRTKGIIQEVEFNNHGQPVSKVASEMQSYIGLITREHIKVNYKTWRQVPKEVKDLIWESVNSSYKVPEKWRSGCLESACAKWRVWKSRLYNDFIVPNKDDPTKLHEPPPNSGILPVDWGQFVISRMSDEFKISNKLSEEQKERRNKNIYPHRLSRKGYAGLAENMKDELYGDDKIDRAIMWKKARMTKEGETKDDNLKMTIQRIDKYIREKEEGVFKSKGRYDDLLTCALENPEHSDRVRGIGAYVNPTTYFNCPREKRHRIGEEQLRELEDAKKRISEQDSVLEEYDTRMHLQDKQIYELLDRIGKLEESMSAKNKLYEEKDSCSVKLPRHEVDEDTVKLPGHLVDEDDEDDCASEDDVILVDNLANLKGTSVALTMGSTKTIVGYGTVVGTNISLHGAPMPKSCMLRNAIGSHVAWPAHLVVAREKTPTKKMVENKVVKERMVKNYASLPSTLKALYCYSEKSIKDGRGILLSLDVDVLGSECDIWILFEDIVPFCDLEPISGNCILAYVWHLYRKLKERNTNDRFLFVNPFTISYAPKVQRDDRARKLANREHWILTIIQPHKELVILMDPLTHRNHDSTWKYVVDIAISMFNANLGKKGKKIPNWEIIKGPIQPDSKQCGYYVMRFMIDIVKGFEKDDTISIGSLFTKKEYSKEEINEVREDWASCVIDHI